MFFGINTVSHDLGLSIIDDTGKIIFYAPTERYNRNKKGVSEFGLHLSKKEKLKCIFDIFSNIQKPKKGDIVCWVSGDFGGMKTKRAMEEMLIESSNQIKNISTNSICQVDECDGIKYIRLDHHIAHAVSSWMFRKDDEEGKFLVYDGGGYGVDHVSYHSTTGYIDKHKLEIIDKNTIPSSFKISNLLGWMSAGKLMGLAGYYPEANIQCEFPSGELMEFAGFYKCFIEDLWNSIESKLDKKVVIAGGTALALEINSRIHSKVNDLVFGPAPDDSGLCLGCSAYGYFFSNGHWPSSISTPSIVSLQSPHFQVGPQSTREIAKEIHEGKVIFLMRGKAECGPRSLGFRSILSSCNIENLKLVSVDIKKREFYRPLAPIVTDSQFFNFFSGPKGQYMQYKVECKEAAARSIPAVVHRDNSSRPQVVCEKIDPWLHELLVEYGKLSGVECLVNTSLNVAGKPICNTNKDLLEFDKETMKNVVVVSIPSFKLY